MSFVALDQPTLTASFHPDIIQQMPVFASGYLRERQPRQPFGLPSGHPAQKSRDC